MARVQRSRRSDRQPIFLTTEDENPNPCRGAIPRGRGDAVDDWAGASLKEKTRIVLLFDGRDPEALTPGPLGLESRRSGAGYEVTYWKQSPAGKWEKQG